MPGLVERLRGVYQEMVEAALSGADVERIAELAARQVGHPVAIVVPERRVAALWPRRGSSEALESLERHEVARVDGQPVQVPPGVELVVPITSGGEVVGSVAMLGGSEPVSAETGEFLHLAALATVTAMAIVQAREQEAARLGAGLIEELRQGQMEGPEVARRAARLGCDLVRGAVVIACKAADRPRQAMALIASEYAGSIAELVDGRIYAVLPARGADDAPELTVNAAAAIVERLRGYGEAAVSSFYPDPADLARGLQEAELVLEVVSRDERMAEQLSDGAGSGVYRLLFRALASHPEEVRRFYEDTVAPIVHYDDQYHTDLLATLEAYLAEDCNMNATARAIYAHRHTVAYRLQRVKELTRLDPLVNADRERLGLGLKAYRIVAPTLPR